MAPTRHLFGAQRSSLARSQSQRILLPPLLVRTLPVVALSVLSVLALLCLALLLPWPVQTQDGAEPVLRITHVDTAHFPDVQVQVYGSNLGAALHSVPLTLAEDGVAQTITQREQVTVGTQTALVLDAAGDVTQRGPTGEPRYVEVGLAARRLVELQLLSPAIDRLTSISFGPDKKLAVLRPWSGDHQAVVDSLYIYEPAPDIGYTPLSDLVLFAASQFDDDDLAEDQERSIVVFSDGVDAVGNTELIDAITDAKNRNIRIHAVMIGPATTATQRNMSRLAAMTNGKYVEFTSVEALDDLWRTIAGGSNQELLTYRSGQPDPREVSVTAEMAGGETLAASRIIPALNLLPVQVNIQSPAAGQVYERQAAAFDTPVGELEPRAIDVQVGFDFPDKLPRAIRRVEYQIGNLPPVVRDEPPSGQPFSVPIDTLGEGDYGLRVRMVDELGLTGESSAVPLRIAEIRPAAPTPTTDPALLAEASAAQERAAAAQAQADEARTQAQQAQAAADAASQEAATNKAAASELQTQLAGASAMLQRLSWVTVGSGALAVLALGLAIYVLSSKDRRRRATEVISGTFKTVTEPFIRPGRKGGSTAAKARLSLVDSAGTPNLPAAIPLYAGSIRIGRDPNLVNVVIEDRRVSRLHCRIVEEGGHFKVLDEGGKSGTYINDIDVGMDGQLLKSGDMLGIGPINYRFDADGAPPKDGPETFTNNKLYDHTEPYVRTPSR